MRMPDFVGQYEHTILAILAVMFMLVWTVRLIMGRN
jgi:hypothetical protein